MGRYKDFKKSWYTHEQNGYYVARKRMIDEQIIGRGVKDARVIKAMSQIPRHLFVPHALWDQAYSDYPLNIGEGQTISQPLMVATMTELLGLNGPEKVLEIGTGSGYQTAILAELCSHVYTVERVRSLANNARKTLYDLGITNFTLKVGDGTRGWSEKGPFDAIITTAGSPVVPKAYTEQLAEGGRLVIPVGGEVYQDLLLLTKKGGLVSTRKITGCRFVKLVGKYGWDEESLGEKNR